MASTGIDYSVNAPAIPNVGANFPGTGPYANYMLIKTISPGTNRNGGDINIQNTSGNNIIIIRDDGVAGNNMPATNASIIPLGGGTGVGLMGGIYTTTSFKGRLQIYAPAANAFVSIFKD